MTLVITGTCPSKKNSKRIAYNKKTGNAFILSSQRSLDWTNEAVKQLQAQFTGLQVSDYPIRLRLTFFNKDRVRRDLDNQTSTTLDALVAAGVLADDSFAYVDRLELRFGGVDKANPRVEIELDD